MDFFIARSLSYNMSGNRVQKRFVSNGKSRFCIIPIKLAYYIKNTGKPAKAFKQPWIIIKLLDEKHVQFPLHPVGCVEPDKRIQKYTRYSIFDKQLRQACGNRKEDASACRVKNK